LFLGKTHKFRFAQPRLRATFTQYVRSFEIPAAMTVFRNSQILIVDSHDTVRSIVRKLFNQLGYNNVDEAPDGAVALAKMSEKNYALIIADWNLGAMDGQALLKQIRAIKQYEHVPFIAMAEKPAINKVVQAKHAGATSFINMPFSAGALRAKIFEINAE
jgi:two-component system chemotaxis response regulator CheY